MPPKPTKEASRQWLPPPTCCTSQQQQCFKVFMIRHLDGLCWVKAASRSVRCLLILAAPEGQKAVRGPPPRVVKDLDPPGSLAAFVLEASERSQRHICYSWTQLIAECMRWGNVCTRLAVEEEKPQYDDGDAMKSFFLLQAAIWLSGQISQNNLIEVKSRHQYQIETIS